MQNTIVIHPRPLGLILCGGKGTRAGGIDKGLQRIHGAPAVIHAARLLEPVCGEILISANRNQERYRALEIGRVMQDLRGDFPGPLAGIEAAAHASNHHILVILPCDMPYLPAEVPGKLVDALKADEGLDLVYARTARDAHYLCAALRTRCAGFITTSLEQGRYAVKDCFAQLRGKSLLFDKAASEGFRNLNHREDWPV